MNPIHQFITPSIQPSNNPSVSPFNLFIHKSFPATIHPSIHSFHPSILINRCIHPFIPCIHFYFHSSSPPYVPPFFYSFSHQFLCPLVHSPTIPSIHLHRYACLYPPYIFSKHASTNQSTYTFSQSFINYSIHLSIHPSLIHPSTTDTSLVLSNHPQINFLITTYNCHFILSSSISIFCLVHYFVQSIY